MAMRNYLVLRERRRGVHEGMLQSFGIVEAVDPERAAQDAKGAGPGHYVVLPAEHTHLVHVKRVSTTLVQSEGLIEQDV